MPILALFTGTMSKAQYEALRKEANWENDQPQGGIFHAASFDEEGLIHVADVWESAEEMGAFVEQRLGPALSRLGITPPDVSVFPAHNINAYAASEAHRI